MVRGFHEKEGAAATVRGPRGAVSLGERLGQRAVPHRAAVDEETDLGPAGAPPIGTGDEAVDARPVHAALDTYELVEGGGSQNLKEPVLEIVHRRRLEERA